MHICFIEDTLFHGGTQIWVAEASRNFLERGESVTLLTPEGGWVAKQSAGTGARLVTYDWDRVAAQDDHHKAIWTNALRDCDLAICTVHPPRRGFHCSIFAARCIKEEGLRTHLVPKTGTIVPDYRREFYLPDETIHSSIIAIADFTRKYLIDTYHIPPHKVALIYQGTDIRRFRCTAKIRAEALKRYPLPQEAAPILGCAGSFEQRKGQPVLFDALSRLACGPLPDIHLMLVGDGPDEKLLRERVVDMGLAKSVSFFPFTRWPERVFARVDITVLPSLYKEGLPNVLLESMAMGVPVIASRLGGVPEIVLQGETGYMVKPGNSGQLADAILTLWADQDARRKMGKRARRLMEDKFDKEIQFNHFLDYLQGRVK